VKFLQSNPVQIVLCVIVLLDAVIVIAQILLDLNSVKRKSTRQRRGGLALRQRRQRRRTHQRSYSTSGPITIGMGDRLRAGKPPRYVTKQANSASYPQRDGK